MKGSEFMFGHWLNKVINGIPKIYRWSGKTLVANPRRNDAEHMWSVAVICDGLARIQSMYFGSEIDMGILFQKAVFHDVSEVETGDILSGVKRRTSTMIKGVKDMEMATYETLLKPIIPPKWRSDYKKLLLNPKDGTIEGDILAVADSIDALNECIQEVRFGNPDFKTALSEIAESILDINIGCGHYFIKYCLIDFGLPINCYGEKIEHFYKTYEFNDFPNFKKNN